MSEQLRRLDDRARHFRAWATELGPERHGEWELAYEAWGDILEAFLAFIDGCPFETWDEDTTDLMLYLVARDNESEYFVDEIAQDPERLLYVATSGIRSRESDARWQLADRLGNLVERRPEAEALLVRYAQDEDQYVRRRASAALERLLSAHSA